MAIVNGNYAKLQDSYLFTDIAKRVAAFTAAHPEKKIIKMGIGDVTLPLAPCVVDAMKKAVEELGHKETFRGYGPEQGYEFLHEAIQRYYARHGVKLDTKDIFISDGAKSDCGNITDLFEDTNVVLVPNPVYPVYADTNVMRGRKILYMNGTPQNHFLPMPDDSVKADIIYLCSPNNPTGNNLSRDRLYKVLNTFQGIVVIAITLDRVKYTGFFQHVECTPESATACVILPAQLFFGGEQ